jgi:hypothetical protein
MVTWRALLVVYRAIRVREPVPFAHVLPEAEVAAGVENFRHFPALAARLSAGEVGVDAAVAEAERPLDTLTPMGDGIAWPSPSDTRPELDRMAPGGAYDSVFVIWPQRDLATGAHVPTGGWGLAIPATDWSNGATYATVANTDERGWSGPIRGEIWLHEWLHGVCELYRRRGFRMPDGDSDGGERSGYRQSRDTGWCDFYGDLMTGRVEVAGGRAGITAEAWRTGSILSS